MTSLRYQVLLHEQPVKHFDTPEKANGYIVTRCASTHGATKLNTSDFTVKDLMGSTEKWPIVVDTVLKYRVFVRDEGRSEFRWTDIVFDTKDAYNDWLNEKLVKGANLRDYDCRATYQPKDPNDLGAVKVPPMPAHAKEAEKTVAGAVTLYDPRFAQTQLMKMGAKITLEDDPNQPPPIPDFLKRSALPAKADTTKSIMKELEGPYLAEFYLASEIAKNPHMVIPYFLAVTYAFCECNERLVSDEFADLMNLAITKYYDQLHHPLKDTITPTEIADSGLYWGYVHDFKTSELDKLIGYVDELISDYGENGATSMTFDDGLRTRASVS